MVEALKKMDRKFLIMTGFIMLLPIFLIIFLAIIQGCGNRKITYEKYESNMISATEKYLNSKKEIPVNEGEYSKVDLKTLVEKGYIKSSGDSLGDETCDGNVTVRRTGSNIESTKGGYLNYTVELKCKDYKTNSLQNLLMNNLTTSGSGLYEQNGKYIFKGEEPKNYLTFYGQNYRILNIDSNGIVKLLKTESQYQERAWDSKYNIETDISSGKNIYSDSNILKKLINDYENEKIISKEAKKHIVPYDICIDSKNINDSKFLNGDNCSNIIKNQVISLMNINDFYNASIDDNCINFNSKSCRNYNYFYQMNLNTWTLNSVSDNTYQVYYIKNAYLNYQDANTYNEYNIVIYIDSKEIVKSGDGTEKSPYIIG